MKILDQAKQSPGLTIILTTAVVLAGGFTAFDKLAWYWQSHATAYAALQEAEQVRSQFDEYITQQKEALKLDKQRNELQEEYNQKLLELQQQQMPNQAAPAPIPESGHREWDADGTCWDCPSDDLDTCYDEGLWRVCER